MKTDKELLQLAAKAAGYHHLTEWSDKITDHDSEHYGQPALQAKGAGGQCKSFNAKISDGDAFRLAVDLEFNVNTRAWCNTVSVESSSLKKFECYIDDCRHEATRWAILTAAAAIGEDME